MLRLLTVLFSAAMAAACVGPNTSLSTLQLSGEAFPFPENYQIEAARVVRDKRGDLAVSRVSLPQQTVGTGALNPRRWYVCISDLPQPKGRDRLPRLMDAAEQWLNPEGHSGTYYAVLFFSGEHLRPTVKTGVDSRLCRDVTYEPITAEPPVI